MLEHATKVVKRVFEHRVRQQVERDDMQFGVMNGERTTDAGNIYSEKQGTLFWICGSGKGCLVQVDDQCTSEVLMSG